MLVRKIAVAALVVFSAVSLRAQDPESFAPREVVRNWTAPPVWSREAAAGASGSAGAGTFASSPMPFIAITPCRIVDTRGGGVFTGDYGPPALVARIPKARLCSAPATLWAVSSVGRALAF